MSFTINAEDPRTIRALELAADAGQWLVCRTPDGQHAYGVAAPGSAGRYYLVTGSSCDCPEFRRDGLSRARIGQGGKHHACEHILAVRLHSELVKAQQQAPPGDPPRRRGHLMLVPQSQPGSSRTAG